MRYTIIIESAGLNQTLANNILAKFIPQASVVSDPWVEDHWVEDPTFDDENGWYNEDCTQFTMLHNQLTGLVLAYTGDTYLNTTDTYVFITYFL